jgi:peptidoglycan hydrolase CwlO-like protein
MRERIFVLLTAGAFVCSFPAYGQDAQSLGDVARQSRLQKQQKDTQTKDSSAQNKDTANKDTGKDAQSTDTNSKDMAASKAPHVITNDEIPEHVGSTFTSAPNSQTPDPSDALADAGNHDARAQQWKSQIQAQKNAIASLEREIATLNESVHYAGGNCVANCVQWNERQKEKQDRVEVMKQQLDEQQKRLEDLQESARKQGFGSAVYEP